jgi:hypothetical protein
MEPVVLIYVCTSQHASRETERAESSGSYKATLKRIFPNNNNVVYRLS